MYHDKKKCETKMTVEELAAYVEAVMMRKAKRQKKNML